MAHRYCPKCRTSGDYRPDKDTAEQDCVRHDSDVHAGTRESTIR